MTNGADRGCSAAAMHAPWRGAFQRHLASLIALKFAALALLWALFFSPWHRAVVDARAAGRQLAVPPPAAALAPPAPAAPHDPHD